MLPRLRRLFFVLTALGYGLLGGGPTLWALGLEAPAEACSMAGCSCHGGHAAGAACCCAAQRHLLAKFPALAKDPFYMKLARKAPVPAGALAFDSASCGDHDAVGLPVLTPHLAVERVRAQAFLRSSAAPDSVPAAFTAFVSDPLERPPSVRA